MALVEDANVLVAPVPGKDLRLLQDGRELFDERPRGFFRQRKRLMMRKKNNPPRANLGQKGSEPIDLIPMELMFRIRRIKTDEQPVVVLHRKVAGRLAESVQHSEIRCAA